MIREFRDGHITMDSLQQAAFRDHIRSGERITFLASTGQLKYRKSRDTIAAEPTPRSSCHSKVDARPPRPPEKDTNEKATQKKSLTLQSGFSQRLPAPNLPPAPTTGHFSRHRSTNSDGRETLDSAKKDTQKVPPSQRSGRPRSVASGREPGSASHPGSGSAPSFFQLREKRDQRPVHAQGVPLHVGPPVAIRGRNGKPTGGDNRCASSFVSRTRSASAEDVRENWAAEGSKADSGGRGEQPRLQPKSITENRHSRRGLSVEENLPRREGQRRKRADRPRQSTKPLLNNLAARKRTAASGNLERTRSATLKRIADDTKNDPRFMPVGSIHKVYRGHRLAAVQAWDPQSAAAVRAARAENLICRRPVDHHSEEKDGVGIPFFKAGASTKRAQGDKNAKGCAFQKYRERPSSAPLTKDRCATGCSGNQKGADNPKGGRPQPLPETGLREPASTVGRREGRDKWNGNSSAERGRSLAANEQRGGKGLTAKKTRLQSNQELRTAAEKRAGNIVSRGVSTPREFSAWGSCSHQNASSGRNVSERGMPEGGSTTRTPTAVSVSSTGHGSGGGSRSAGSKRSNSARDSKASSRLSVSNSEERRAVLKAELEPLRRTLREAEYRLRRVEYSLRPKRRRRPHTATACSARNEPGKILEPVELGAATVAPTTVASVESSMGHNPEERVASPLIVTHAARALLNQL